MFEAKAIKNFTWSKRDNKLYKKGEIVKELTQRDVEYLQANKVIGEVKEIEEVVKIEVIEVAKTKAKTQKAVKSVKGKKK